MTIRQRLAITATMLTLAFASCSPLAAHAATGTPAASPITVPTVTGNGCDQLGSYFKQLAKLTAENDGLTILATVNNDALALTSAKAAEVARSLDDLIAELKAVTPPTAAKTYHLAYIDFITWYRDLALHRDAAAHQRLINADKRIFPALGRGISAGQAICGADAWNAAQQAAFPPTPTP
ncbi:MAG TPA: hypothetical protein VFQ54_01310 [Thermomicrobiales bacterium]|nr:hypothetical protein [Thermomicrobiales bacterium]